MAFAAALRFLSTAALSTGCRLPCNCSRFAVVCCCVAAGTHLRHILQPKAQFVPVDLCLGPAAINTKAATANQGRKTLSNCRGAADNPPIGFLVPLRRAAAAQLTCHQWPEQQSPGQHTAGAAAGSFGKQRGQRSFFAAAWFTCCCRAAVAVAWSPSEKYRLRKAAQRFEGMIDGPSAFNARSISCGK